MNQKGIYDHIDTATLVKALRQYVEENRFSSNPRTILFGLAADRLEENVCRFSEMKNLK